MSYVVPLVFLVTIIIGAVKRISVYDSFIEGIKEALFLTVSLLPYLMSIFILLEVFEASGANVYISKYLGSFFGLFGIPEELSELIIIRPISGSGSLGVLEKILSTYGGDSYVGKCASVICGCNDTIFYIVAVYMSRCKEKKAFAAIIISVVASFIGVIVSCFICKFI